MSTIDRAALPLLDALNPWWGDGHTWQVPAHPNHRDLHHALLSGLLDPSNRRAQLLLGPRQVGKTTLLKQIVHDLLTTKRWPSSNITYFDFSDPRATRLLDRLTLGAVAAHLPTNARDDLPRILLVDEIHFAADWSQWLKHIVDEDRLRPESKLRVLATDSAAALLKRGSIESGQGRWSEVHIAGLTFSEYLRFLGRSGDAARDVLQRRPEEFERYLSKGGWPEHVFHHPSDDLRSRIREDIAERAIRRDLLRPDLAQAAGERLDVDRIRRLFTYLVQDSGQILNISERARDLDSAHRASVSEWIRLLRDACLLRVVEPYAGHVSSKASHRLAAKEKVYAAEHGLIPAFALSPNPMGDPHVRGRVFEAVVLRHLDELLGGSGDVHYFRRNDDLEIDFVVRAKGEIWAIEVTSSAIIDGKKRRRILEASKVIGASKTFVIHGGTQIAHHDDGSEIPIHAFLLDPTILERGVGR